MRLDAVFSVEFMTSFTAGGYGFHFFVFILFYKDLDQIGKTVFACYSAAGLADCDASALADCDASALADCDASVLSDFNASFLPAGL